MPPALHRQRDNRNAKKIEIFVDTAHDLETEATQKRLEDLRGARPQSMTERYLILDDIFDNEDDMNHSYSLREAQRLHDVTMALQSFSKGTKPHQREIDQYCGFSTSMSIKARKGNDKRNWKPIPRRVDFSRTPEGKERARLRQKEWEEERARQEQKTEELRRKYHEEAEEIRKRQREFLKERRECEPENDPRNGWSEDEVREMAWSSVIMMEQQGRFEEARPMRMSLEEGFVPKHWI